MPKASPQQTTFNSGELSPLMFGRQDTERYRAGMATCFNGIPLVQGPWTRRPGFVYAHTTKFGGDREARLLEFEFSTLQNYILEFGHEYIRFYTNGGILTEGSTRPISDITLDEPGVATSTGHGFSDGDRIILSNSFAMPGLTGREIEVTNSTTDTFELYDIYGDPIDTAPFLEDPSGSHSGATKIFELASDYIESDLDELRVVQSADILYILHPLVQPRKLIRTGATSWSLQSVTFEDGPYGPINDTDTTIWPDTTGPTGITLTANSSTGINNDEGFKSTDVGRWLRWQGTVDLEWTWFLITDYVSPLVVEATRFGPTWTSAAPSDVWRLGLWSDTTGWPATGTFHEDRLILGGSPEAPMRFDGSRTSDYENFSPSDADGVVADDHAIAATMSSGQVNAVRWLTSDAKGLLVGTSGGEWVVSPSSLNEPLTPANVSARKASAHGSANIDAVRVGNATLFIQRAGQKLREMAYVFEADSFRAPDMSVLAEHIPRPGLKLEIAIQRQPQPVIWAIRTDGKLVGLTYDRGQDTVAWHLHDVSGEVESLGVIPDPTATYDEVFAIVKREINGRDERYIEFMSKLWEQNDEQEDALHVDSAVVETGLSLGYVAGLGHLEGEEVALWADGGIQPAVTVENGMISIDSSFDTVTVGLAFTSDGEIMPIEAGAADGSAQSKTKRIHRIGLWLMDTMDLQIGSDEDNLDRLIFSEWGQSYNEAPPLFTGVRRERFEADFDRLGQVFFRIDSPAPATVLSLMLQLHTEDDS